MLRQRLIVSIVLIPPGLFAIHRGGGWYLALLLVFFLLAGREYSQIMRRAGHRPAEAIVVGAIALLCLIPVLTDQAAYAGLADRWSLEGGALGLTLIVATAWHLLEFERGLPNAGSDWAVTIAGAVYLGWLGSYFLRLRNLPDGEWWTLVVLPAVWLSDTGAYAFGRWFGRHALAPRLSPKKTWEGFFGGLVWGTAFGALLGGLWRLGAGEASAVNATHGALVGFIVSLVGPIGDLGVSMLKRQVGVKDTGSALIGHGGMLDRVDSWLIAAAVGYYVVLFLTR